MLQYLYFYEDTSRITSGSLYTHLASKHCFYFFIDIEIPERPRLRIYDKVPMYPANLKPPKMQKRLRYMRGPETLHTNLQLKQYGVVVSL